VTFTYSSTSISTDLAKVRLRVGDVVEYTNEPLRNLTDEEIAYVLTIHTDLDDAAVRCLELLIAKLRQYVTWNQSGSSSNAGDQLDHAERTLKLLKGRALRGGEMTCYTGGISNSRNETTDEDTDYVQPFAKVGMDDNPGAATTEPLHGDD
jgi:hypothetical protein